MNTQSQLPRSDGLERAAHEPLATSAWIPQETLVGSLYFEEHNPNNISPFIFGQIRNEATSRHLFLNYEDDSHLATFAGSRAGKGVSLVIPNLLSYQGSMICVDLKGENAAITADYRRDVLGQEVIVLDPFNVTQFKTASLNPLSFIEPDSKVLIDDINDIADALIVRSDAKNAHWDESAKSVIKMILLFIVLEHEDNTKNLIWLREYLLNGIALEEEVDEDGVVTEGESSFNNFLIFLSHYPYSFISGMAKRLLEMGDNERGSVMSTVHRNTEFLDSLSLQDVISTSDLDLSQLRTKKGASIYLVMPERRLAQQSRWLRLLITVFLQHLQSEIKTSYKDPSVLFVLDESASLGYMQVIERAMGYIAGFGVKLWVIFQDLNQLKDIYPKRWETFLGNAGILTAFGNIDITTQNYLSSRLGKCETKRIEYNYSGSQSKNDTKSPLFKLLENPDLMFGEGGSEGQNSSWNAQPRDTINPLLLPDEIGREFGKNSGKVLVLIGGAKPIWAERIYYYQDAPFKDRAGENPYYRT